MAAITRFGSEFRVNTETTGAQEDPCVAALQNGGYVITWSSAGQDGSETGIYAQRYDADGTPAGGEFLVNSTTNLSQSRPQVTTLADGSFVIIWESNGTGGSYEVVAQRYDADGTPQGGEFQINTFTTGNQDNPTVTALDGGGFVVSWTSRDQEGIESHDGVYAQQFNADGTPVGAEFLVNTYTDNGQSAPSITSLADGGYVITWMSNLQEGGIQPTYGVYGQRYDANGVAVGGEFHVNTTTYRGQRNPDVVGLENGGFLVVWEENTDGSYLGINAQLYDASGAPVGGEFPINTYTHYPQYTPSIAAMPDGGFIVVWVDALRDTFAAGIYAQRFDADGVKIGPETLINTYIDKGQERPTIATLEDGGFVISWESFEQDGGVLGIYAQQFDAQMFGTQGADEMSDTTGTDWMRGRDGDDMLYGLDGNDLIHGGRGDDTLYGGTGNDRLKGNAGDDTLYGGIGNDILKGQAGDDILVGGAGRDVLVGGAGADIFVFNQISDSVAGANDRIKDFEQGADLIDFSAFEGTFSFIGSDGFSGTGAEIMAVQNNGNTILRIDVDGDGTSDMRIFVKGLVDFTEGDFIL